MTLSGKPSKTAQEKPSKKRYRALSEVQVGDRIVENNRTATVVCIKWNDSGNAFGKDSIAVTLDNEICHTAKDMHGTIWAPNNNGYIYNRDKRFLKDVWLLEAADPIADAMSNGAEQYHAIFQAQELMESEDV